VQRIEALMNQDQAAASEIMDDLHAVEDRARVDGHDDDRPDVSEFLSPYGYSASSSTTVS
jgi:hypothetical protein